MTALALVAVASGLAQETSFRLDFQESLARADGHDPRVRLARTELALAAETRDAARDALGPGLSVHGQALRRENYGGPNRESLEFFFPREAWELRATLAQPLYEPGLFPRREAARLEREAAEGLLEAIRRTVAREAARAHFRLLDADLAVRMAGQSVLAARAALAQARVKLAAGEGLQEDLDAAQVAADAAQARADAEKRALDSTWRALARLTGSPKLALDRPPPGPLPDLGEVDAWLDPSAREARLGEHPDLRALKPLILAGQSILEAARAASHPSLSLEASESRLDGGEGGVSGDEWTVGLVLRHDLLDRGERKRSRSQAAATLARARARLAGREDDLRAAGDEAADLLATERDRVRLAILAFKAEQTRQASLAARHRLREVEEEAWQRGNARLEEARLELARRHLAYLWSKIELAHAVGQWPLPSPEAGAPSTGPAAPSPTPLSGREP